MSTLALADVSDVFIAMLPVSAIRSFFVYNCGSVAT